MEMRNTRANITEISPDSMFYLKFVKDGNPDMNVNGYNNPIIYKLN